MDGNALVNMLKDRRILVLIIAAIVVIAAVAVYISTSGDDGSDDPSDGLTVDGEKTISEDTVIKGTLEVTDKGRLTLANGAEIMMLGEDAKIDVKGSLDATDGSIVFVTQDEDGKYSPIYDNGKDGRRSVASTGTLTMNPDNFASEDFLGNVTGIMDFANGAIYVNTDGKVVLTTVAKAAAANSNVEVFGNVTENSDITMSGDEVLWIMEGASVTLKTINLSDTTSDDEDVVVSGKLTASVSATDIGTVALSAASGIFVDLKTTGTGSSAESDLIVSGTVEGAVTVSSGTVDVDNIIVNGTGNTLTVASGASLNLATGSSLTAGSSAEGKTASVKVDGNIIFDGGAVKAVSTTVKALVDVAGTATVLEPTTIDGTVNLSGVLVLGEKPTDYSKVAENKTTFTSNVNMAADAYVKVYGDGIYNPTPASNIVNTVFNVNGNEYMTVYANSGDVAISTVLKAESFVNGQTAVAAMSNCKNWNQNEDYLGESVADNKNIGETGYSAVHYQTDTVTIKFDVPTGTSVEIGPANNSVKIESSKSMTLVVSYEYNIKVNEGTAKYGDADVGNVLKPDVKTTTFTVTKSS